MAPPDFSLDDLGSILDGLSEEDFSKISELAQSFSSESNENKKDSPRIFRRKVRKILGEFSEIYISFCSLQALQEALLSAPLIRGSKTHICRGNCGRLCKDWDRADP